MTKEEEDVLRGELQGIRGLTEGAIGILHEVQGFCLLGHYEDGARDLNRVHDLVSGAHIKLQEIIRKFREAKQQKEGKEAKDGG